MTEAEWLACEEPQAMLAFLRGKAADRKLWLSGCAFCRRLWDRLHDSRSQQAVETTERFVEGGATSEELAAKRLEAHAAYRDADAKVLERSAACAAYTLVHAPEWLPARWPCVHSVSNQALLAAAFRAEREGKNRGERKQFRMRGHCAEGASQCALLRDIFGNPFRPAICQPLCRTSVVASIAQAAYDERLLPGGHLDLTRLAILADALEEAGCADADLLSHLRSPGPHVRGCWALDLVLGKS